MSGTAACQATMGEVGAGIGSSLRGVDCAASQMAQAAFNRLFTPDGAFGPTLTALLTIWIAFLGYSLITGRSRIGIASLTPKMLTLVLVLTFATSWFVFQNFFWNLAVLGPDEIASVLMGTHGSATTIFADKLDIVMASLMQASGGDAMDNNTSLFSPPGLLWAGGTMLLLGTVGVLATCKIALAILMGLGPIFIVMALFDATKGLFVGWLKGVVLMALTPLFAVLGGSLMLELAIPVLGGLAATPGKIDVRPAMAFFMIGAVHLALMGMVLKVTGTMVGGWTVFGFAGRSTGEERPHAPIPAAAPAAIFPAASNPAAVQTRANIAAPAMQRDIRIASPAPFAANDTGGGASAGTSRETRIITGTNPQAPGQPAASNRARGIGSRFKSAPIRSTEKQP